LVLVVTGSEKSGLLAVHLGPRWMNNFFGSQHDTKNLPKA